jgi:hypothetical protein
VIGLKEKQMVDSLCIPITFFQQPIIQLLANSLSLVVQLVDISRAGVGYPHDRPERFRFTFSLVGFILGISHLLRIIIENLNQHGKDVVELKPKRRETYGFYVLKAFWRPFGPCCPNFWHGG